MNRLIVLKALADDSRLKIVTLLIHHNFCVRALAKRLHLTEATVSQHIKVLREAGLLIGERKGYYMHYAVNRELLQEFADDISLLAKRERREGSTCGKHE